MKSSLFGVAVSMAVASWAGSVGAVPVVGPPFFLANPKNDAPEYSIASSSRGFLLGWSALGSTYAQRYTPSASLDGRPFKLAGVENSNPDGHSHGSTSTSGVVVVSNGVDFAARWTRTTTLLVCCVSTYTWDDFGGALVRSSGSPESSSVFGISGTITRVPSGAVAPASPGWVILDATLAITPPSTGAQSISLEWIAADGTTTTAVSLLSAAVSPSLSYGGYGVASDGVTALATWVELPGPRSFVVVPRSGAPSTLVDPKLPTSSESVVVASNGAGYLVVSQSVGGNIEGLPLTTSGAVSGASIMISKGADAGAAPSVVAVRPAGGTYLILLREASGDGGTRLAGVRIARDGSVLDSPPFEIPAGEGEALTSVADGVWLLATLDSVGGAPIIRGRFIGDSTVPSPPDNVEPPPLPDAGPSEAAVRSDARPARGDGALTPSPSGSGGSGPIVSAPGSGGSSASADAGTGGSARNSSDGKASGGCTCALGETDAPPRRRGAYSLLLGVAGLLRRRRRAGHDSFG